MRRLLEATALVGSLSAEALAIYNDASRQFPKDELLGGQDVVRRSAGLAPVWDAQWIDSGSGTRRDVLVAAVWDFDRTLVDPNCRVARSKVHNEDFYREWNNRIDLERAQRAGIVKVEPERLPGHSMLTVQFPEPLELSKRK